LDANLRLVVQESLDTGAQLQAGGERSEPRQTRPSAYFSDSAVLRQFEYWQRPFSRKREKGFITGNSN
jgi:hypothetical protein